MRVLIACEYSGREREAFAAQGHDTWSCDLLDTEIPGNHIKGDVLEVLDQDWDLMVAHPPCTYLSYAATAYWNQPGREERRKAAMEFFLRLYNAPIPKIAIENPVGWPNTVFRSPDQILQPYYFGEQFKKRSCLWLKGLPKLVYKRHIIEPEPIYVRKTGPKAGKKIHWTEANHGGHVRSKSFESIANAMAVQWSRKTLVDY